MPLYYFSRVPAMSECIGNSLSTINIDLSSLDNRMYQLSSYTVNSVNFLSASVNSVSANLQTQINFLSSSVNSVSANLQTQINSVSANLQTQINFLSSSVNSVIDIYTQQGIIFQNSNGTITWNVTAHGHNAKVTLTANGNLGNVLNCNAGDTGNLVIQLSSTAGLSITGWGNNFLFANSVSSMSTAASAYNLLSFYYDGTKFLSNMRTF
jgi:hypothetical protein